MNTITLNVIFFIVVYLLVFIFCYFFAGKLRSKSKDKDKKKRKNKTTFKMMNEGTFLIKRYNLVETKINLKKMNFGIANCNALIIAFTSTFISAIDIKIYYKFAIAFVLLFALIYAIFEIYGRYLNKKWGKKHE